MLQTAWWSTISLNR